MSAQTLISSKFRLFEKKYLVSRIACSIFIITWVLYLWGGRPFTAKLISAGAIILFTAKLSFSSNG